MVLHGTVQLRVVSTEYEFTSIYIDVITAGIEQCGEIQQMNNDSFQSLLSNTFPIDVPCSSGTVTATCARVKDSTWSTLHWRADTRAAASAEYLWLGAWVWLAAQTPSKGNRTGGSITIANRKKRELPVAEGIGVFRVWTWLGGYAGWSAPDVFTRLAATFHVIIISP